MITKLNIAFTISKLVQFNYNFISKNYFKINKVLSYLANTFALGFIYRKKTSLRYIIILHLQIIS